MVREALRERFLAVLTEQGGSAGNGRLLAELDWAQPTYDAVHAELLEEGLIVKGRGRWSLSLANQKCLHNQQMSAPAATTCHPSLTQSRTGGSFRSLRA